MPTRPGAWDLFHGGEFFEPLDRYVANRADFIDCTIATLGEGWRFDRNDVWFHCVNPASELIPQGWKIHLSATTSNANTVLERVLPILRREVVNFKIAADKRLLSSLNAKGSFRGGSGKFMTIYPESDQRFRSLLAMLHEATRGLGGPYILSDKRYADSRVLFYRYGGFWPRKMRSNDGMDVSCILDPDGNEVPDKRTPYYAMPAWVDEPFPAEAASDGEARTLKDGRYFLEGAFTYTNSGGVYLATDREHDRKVVIKEGRPLVSRTSEHDDAIALVKKEGRLLELLSGADVAPAIYDSFMDWEHWFIVQEYIDGVSLWEYSVRKSVLLNTDPTPDDYSEFVRTYSWLFAALAEAVRRVHERGVVLADLSPHNVIVREDERRVVLIDFEAAFLDGVDAPTTLATPGFVSPRRRASRMVVPTLSDDLYALGASMLSFIFRVTPHLELNPAATQRLVANIVRDAGLPDEVARAIEALLGESETDRPSVVDVRDVVAGVTEPVLRPPSLPVFEDHALLRQVDSAANYIELHATPADAYRLFPCDFRIYRSNPFGFAYGAAGILHALATIGRSVDPKLVDWVAEGARRKELQPGLAIGDAGIAWTLARLGRIDEAQYLLDRALANPMARETEDLFYGAAGIGLSALAMYAQTGEARYVERAQSLADDFIARAISDEQGRRWQWKGVVRLGLAFGGSGMALFLLYLYLANGERRYLEYGLEALRFEVAQAHLAPYGGLEMPYVVGDYSIVSPYWAAGSAGVASTALRYKAFAGISEFDDQLAKFARSANRKYTMNTSVQFGLAGIGDVNLDWFSLLGDESGIARAERVAGGMLLYAVDRPDGLAFPGTEQNKISCDWATGSAGAMLFLHRLATRRGSDFLPDDLGRALIVT